MVPLVLALSLETARLDPPFARVHGAAQVGGRWVVGGLRGLAVKRGPNWETISHESVKSVLASRGEVWVLYGSGAVDKVDLAQNRHYHDVLAEGTKRPWAASFATDGDGVLFGTYGGFVAKSPRGQVERHFDLGDKPGVTAIARWDGAIYLGTQNGLYRVRGDRAERLGYAAGLPDTWISALAVQGGRLWVGTQEGGLGWLKGGKFQAEPTPSRRIRQLAVWRGELVVGTLEGAFQADQTCLCEEEVTGLSEAEGRLVIGTRQGARLLTP